MFIPPLKNKRNRIIIVSPRQFGYQTDYLKYCEYLKNSNEVVFLLWIKVKRRSQAMEYV